MFLQDEGVEDASRLESIATKFMLGGWSIRKVLAQTTALVGVAVLVSQTAAHAANISVRFTSTISGGITNSGAISGGNTGTGITVVAKSSLTGGLTNTGVIKGGSAGIAE